MQTSPITTQSTSIWRSRRYPVLGLAALVIAGLATGVTLHWNERLYFYLTRQMSVTGNDLSNRWLPMRSPLTANRLKASAGTCRRSAMTAISTVSWL